MEKKLARLMEMREEIWDNMSTSRAAYFAETDNWKAVNAEIKYVKRMMFRNARKA